MGPAIAVGLMVVIDKEPSTVCDDDERITAFVTDSTGDPIRGITATLTFSGPLSSLVLTDATSSSGKAVFRFDGDSATGGGLVFYQVCVANGLGTVCAGGDFNVRCGADDGDGDGDGTAATY